MSANNVSKLTREKPWIAVCVLFLLGLGIRLIGIKWGLPDLYHTFSYHPDESLLLSVALRLDLVHGVWDPNFYNYGAGYLYLLHLITLGVNAYSTPSIAGYLLTARVANALFGSGTVVVGYLIGKRLTNSIGAWATGLILAFAPAYVVHSRFATVDIPAVFFISLSLLFAVKVLQSNAILRYALWGGVFAGLAAGFKYNAGLVIVAVIFACWLATKYSRQLFSGIVLAMVGAVVGFLITTPGVIFNFTRFWEDFSFERGHMMNSNFDLTFQQTPPGWIYHIVPNLSTGFGGLLLIFCVAGLIWGLTRRDKSIWIILSFGALYFLMIGSFQVKFLRYTFPLYPVLAVGGGYWLGRVWESSKWRWLGLGAFIVVLTYTLVPMMKMTGYMISLDPRDEAAKYIRAQVPTGSKIGFAKVPWFYSPPLFPETNAPGPPQARLDLMSKQPNLVMAQGSDWNLDLIWQIRPNCIILTQFETMEEARLKLPEYEAFMDALRGQYRLVNRWGEGFMAPHDLLYIHPEVQLWQRQ